MQLGDVEGLLQDVGGEGARGVLGELFGEGEDEDSVEARGFEEFELAGEGRDEWQACVGAEDSCGVGIEGDGDGGLVEFPGAGDDLGDDPLVAAMNPVEVADGGDGGAEVGGEIGELAIDAHQAISKVICWPS